MKNVQILSGRPSFRVPLPGAPGLRGWAIKYRSGMETEEDIKPGYWLSEWIVNADRTSATFRFESEPQMVFYDEAEAKQVSEALGTHSEIETEVVKLG